jgi:sugar phosphate isomerase/epimerase
MKPALAQISSLNSSFQVDVEDYAAGACSAIEVWFTKLEDYLAQNSIQRVRELIQQHEVTLPVASLQGGLFTPPGEAHDEHWALFTRRLELCRDLGIGTVVVSGDLQGPLTESDLKQAVGALHKAGRTAAEHGVRVAFEFQATADFANNLDTAASLVAECDHEAVGICLDAFHYHVGPSKPHDLRLLSRENLFHVQLCDLLGCVREMATDAQRILPGDGDIQLDEIVSHLQAIDYEGYVSIEVMNPLIWQASALNLGEIGMTALRKVLGSASMD